MLSCSPSNQAFTLGSAWQPATMARIRRRVISVSCDQWLTLTWSNRLTGTTCCPALAMAFAMVRATPFSGVLSPWLCFRLACCCTSSRVMLPAGPLPLIWSRLTPRWRARARMAGVVPPEGRESGTAPITKLSGLSASSWLCRLPTTVWLPLPSSPAKASSGSPVCTRSPLATNRVAMMPSRGAGISTMALAVSTLSSRSSTFTVSPSFTCHSTTSASCKPSPRSGRVK